MDDNWIINKLKKDNIFNPFNDKFDFIEAMKIFTQSIKRDKNIKYDVPDNITLLTTYWFNKYYVDLYSYLRDLLSKVNVEKKKLIQIICSSANRDVYILRNFKYKPKSEEKILDIEDYQKFKITPLDKEYGNIDIQSLVDITIDVQNVFLNFIRYFDEIDIKEKKEEEEIIKTVINIYRVCNLYYNIKNAFDTAVWENGYITYDQINKRLDIKYKDPTLALIIKAGDIRWKRNVAAAIIHFEEKWKNDENFKSLIINHYSQYKGNNKLHKIKFNNGYIGYNLRQGVEIETIYLAEIIQIHLDVYYPFISADYLPRLDNMNLLMLIIIFSEIHFLFDQLRKNDDIETQINKLADYSRFSVQIKEELLLNYLILKTNFSENQIKQFINFLTYSGGRIDLWKTPFIKIEDFYIVSLLNIVDANILYLVDVWLNLGGYSLEDRGILFEKYIKRDLIEEMQKRKFFCIIPKINKFKNLKKQTEEIDLIINTRHTIIFGEIKCVTYPLEPRDYSNALSRLKRGVKQINRKANFIMENPNDFKPIIGEYIGKEIVKLVITNYPFFTSMQFDDVIIVDYYLLKAYINSGQLLKMKINFENDNIKTSEHNKTEIFYSDENQFSRNIKQYMKNPPAVTELIKLLTIKTSKLSLPEDVPQIYIESADTIQEIILNEN